MIGRIFVAARACRCRSVGGSPRDFIGREASISRGTEDRHASVNGPRVDISRDDTCWPRRGMPLSGSSNDPWNSYVTPNCSIKAPPCLTRRIFRTRGSSSRVSLGKLIDNPSYFSHRVISNGIIFFSFLETNKRFDGR